MTLQSQAIVDAVVSHALASGLFERVNAYEPKSPPGSGLTAAVWAESMIPSPKNSGLAATTLVVTLKVQLYLPLGDPQAAIDPAMMNAVDVLCAAYSGDFTLGGLVREVDLLGHTGGTGLSARAGHVSISQRNLRVYEINLPVVIDNLWTQAP